MKSKKKFKVGDRVWHKNMGYGTVTVDTYHTIHFTTWTCVKYDDFLGQKHSLCGETEELIFAQDICEKEGHDWETYTVSTGYWSYDIEQAGCCKRCHYDTHGEE